MFYQLFEKLDKTVAFDRAQAHCDVPCGIYDPSTAQIAALTVVRMMDLMAAEDHDGVAHENSMGRYITVKEEHAYLTLTIWISTCLCNSSCKK